MRVTISSIIIAIVAVSVFQITPGFADIRPAGSLYEIYGSVNSAAVRGIYCYAMTTSGQLVVFDVASIDSPNVLAMLPLATGFEELRRWQDCLWIKRRNELAIISIMDRDNPRVIFRENFDLRGWDWCGLSWHNERNMLVTYTRRVDPITWAAGVLIYDVSAGGVQQTESREGYPIMGGAIVTPTAFLYANPDQPLRAYSRRNWHQLYEADSIPYPFATNSTGTHLYAYDQNLQGALYDISNDQPPQFVRAVNWPYFKMINDTLFCQPTPITYFELSLADPQHPETTFTANLPVSLTSLDRDGVRAVGYSQAAQSFYLVDLTNPDSSSLGARLPSTGSVTLATAWGNRLFSYGDSIRIEIFDRHDPLHPEKIGGFDPEVGVRRMACNESCLLIETTDLR